MSVDVKPGRWYRHVKTGGGYYLQAVGKIESTLEEVAIYRSRSTGDFWVRPVSEFGDGRFEIIEFGKNIDDVFSGLSDKELRKLADDIMDGGMS